MKSIYDYNESCPGMAPKRQCVGLWADMYGPQIRNGFIPPQWRTTEWKDLHPEQGGYVATFVATVDIGGTQLTGLGGKAYAWVNKLGARSEWVPSDELHTAPEWFRGEVERRLAAG